MRNHSLPSSPSAARPTGLVERLWRYLLRRKFYTVLILPHSAQRFRKIHLSHRFVASVVGLATVLMLAGLYAPHLLFQMRSQSVVLDRLAQENQGLRGETERFEGILAGMQDQLETYEAQALRLAQELNVTDLPAGRPAAGGGGPIDDSVGPRRMRFDDELRSLRSRTETLDRSFSQLDDAFHARARALSSTPNLMPVAGWFSDGYGWRKDPFTGKKEFHSGFDIVAPPGTAIVASADGTISRAGRLSDYGKSVDVSHGYGYVTRYAHMSEILVRPGQKVHRGEVIGRVGSTGRSTGPHLHYEVFRDGRRVNPWAYLGQKDS